MLFVWIQFSGICILLISCYILLVDSIIVSTLVITHLGIADLPPGTSRNNSHLIS